MSVAYLEHDETQLRLEMHNVRESFANMLRRALFDVSVPATTNVFFRKNGSAFVDEVLAHRFAMVPLRVNTASDPSILCSDTHSAKKMVSLKARGPCVVRADALDTAETGFEVVDPSLLLVTLTDESEEIDCDWHVDVGTGTEHARHQAVVAPTIVRRHDGMQFVSFDLSRNRVPLCAKMPNECFCDTTPYGTAKCPECNGARRDLELKNAPMTFTLQFETTGALTPIVLLQQALVICRASAQTIRDSLSL